MDPCWKNTPKEIVNYILRLACSRLVYRDNRYIEIGDVHSPNNYIIRESLMNKRTIYDNITDSIDGTGWYFEFSFYKRIDGIYPHGLHYNYNFEYEDTFIISYYIERTGQYHISERECVII